MTQSLSVEAFSSVVSRLIAALAEELDAIIKHHDALSADLSAKAAASEIVDDGMMTSLQMLDRANQEIAAVSEILTKISHLEIKDAGEDPDQVLNEMLSDVKLGDLKNRLNARVLGEKQAGSETDRGENTDEIWD